MSKKITVLKVTETKAAKGYPIVELAYKTEEGQTKSMKIFGFGDQKGIADVCREAKQGDVLEVEFEKNARGFWDFKSVLATGEVAATKSVSSDKPAKVGTWETPEERAVRQVAIARQSSLERAIEFLVATKGKSFTLTDVTDVASVLVEFVTRTTITNKQQVEQTGDVE